MTLQEEDQEAVVQALVAAVQEVVEAEAVEVAEVSRHMTSRNCQQC